MKTSQALAVALGFLAVVPSYANIVDQNAPVENAYMAAFSQTDLAQSFQQSSNWITGAGIKLEGFGGQDNVTISLWNALPNAGGAQLASASALGTAGQWVDVFFNAPVSIVANTTYFLVFGGNNSLGIRGDIYNGYSNGQVYANSGYQAFANYDYTFRTFTTAVPEPTTYALLALGLGVLAFARRKVN